MRHGLWRSILALTVGAFATAAAQADHHAAAAAAGCAACAAPSCCDAKAKAKVGARLPGFFRIGDGCAMPNGCSNTAAERTFMFGSCKQFFNAGTDCKVKNPVYGPKCAVPPCTYGTYLNR